jgi:hypothetical protein
MMVSNCFNLMVVIEIDLRLPSMIHGKKGVDKIVYAFKNVLNDSHTWLFVDLDHADLTSGTSRTTTSCISADGDQDPSPSITPKYVRSDHKSQG